MKKRTVIANWKMNPQDIDTAASIFGDTEKVSSTLKNTVVVVCPPHVYLESIGDARKKTYLGAQNISALPEGAHTGEISVSMVKNLGATHVIVGHSERRLAGETNAMVADKVAILQKAGLVPVVCVGETVRDSEGHYLADLAEQLEVGLSKVQKKNIAKLIVAYEPVWAIGKESAGPATPADVRETSLYILRILTRLFGKDANKVTILYGGSVDAKNALSFLAEGGVSGLLVGRVSLTPKAFKSLLTAVDNA